jgi:phosphotriesterase-related protein
MRKVMTVCGPIAPWELGVTSMHEHVLVNSGVYAELFGPLLPTPDQTIFPCDRKAPIQMDDLGYLCKGGFILSEDNWDLNDETLMTEEVRDFKTAGGGAILECSVPGIRGDVSALRSISQNTGVHIIASTGLYGEESWPARFKEMSYGDFKKYLKSEIEEGIEGSTVRPGQIKSAVNHYSEKTGELLKAVGASSAETGMLITGHIGISTSAEEREKMLQAYRNGGVDPSRLLICHIDSTFVERDLVKAIKDPQFAQLDIGPAKRVLDMGGNVCIDLFGCPFDLEELGQFMVSDQVKMAGLFKLIEAGYEDQLVIGADIFTKIQTRRYGGNGYPRLLNFVVPMLRKLDVSEHVIRKIIVDNPARLLAF